MKYLTDAFCRACFRVGGHLFKMYKYQRNYRTVMKFYFLSSSNIVFSNVVANKGNSGGDATYESKNKTNFIYKSYYVKS